MWEKIGRYYPPWLELIPIACITFAWAYTGARYGLLPEHFPTHFGLSGQPDDWSQKSFWSVYIIMVIGTLVWLSMFLINYLFIIKPVDPAKYINLPQRQKQAMGEAQLEAIRGVTAKGMVAINITMVAMFTVMQYGSINTALGLQKGLGLATSVLAGALVIESLWMTFKTLSMSSSSKQHR